MPAFIDITGLTFGRLTVLGLAENAPRKNTWRCECVCGEFAVVAGWRLRSGHTSSCGCMRSEQLAERNFKHGRDGTTEHRIWRSMNQRCGNPNDADFANYGGRGISVCERWKNSFENFISDMGARPAGCSLDRIDNHGNYEPGNCRWATRSQQSRNTSRNIFVTLNGERMVLADAIARSGIPRGTIRTRIKNGWPIDRVFQSNSGVDA